MSQIVLSKVAREILDECDGDREAAIEKLAVHESPKVRAALIRFGAETAVRLLASGERRALDTAVRAAAIARGVAAQKADAANGAARNRAAQDASLMAFVMPLQGQPLLGDCERSQVEEGAAFYGSMASTCSVNASWLKLVANAMPKGSRKHVRNVMSEEKLIQLRERSEP